MALQVLVLAAGNGKRMVSSLPKVLHTIGGQTMLERVVATAATLNPKKIHVIYGNGGEAVPKALPHLPVHWVRQKEQLGTGHAVMQALPHCGSRDRVLVLYGDVPLISNPTLTELLSTTPENGLGLVVTELEDPTGFGRIIRSEMGQIISIVEHKDASIHQLKIQEINTGILTASVKHLREWLPRVKNYNKQKEYYLTDIVSLAVQDGVAVGGVATACREEVQGVNNRWEQAKLERYFQQREAYRLAQEGVCIRDPYRLDIRGQVTVGRDVVLDVNVVLEGRVQLGNECQIGPNVFLKDVMVEDGVQIKANSVVEGAHLQKGCQIGPFARIRPQTVVEPHARVGNFVEVKNTHLGTGSKVNHLTYLGDAEIGREVNIGAGVITCNYDGKKKSTTVIQDRAFIGSNSALIAPVNIGKEALIGAGSVITKEAPARALTLTRAPQLSSPKKSKK